MELQLATKRKMNWHPMGVVEINHMILQSLNLAQCITILHIAQYDGQLKGIKHRT